MTRPDTHNQRVTIGGRWSCPKSGQDYAQGRWRSSRARQRDGRLLARLLRGALLAPGPILDAPCGAGRLGEVLRNLGGDPVSLDLSGSMLNQVQGPRRLQGSAFHLPFADHSFPLVVCCRLLHHLSEPTDQAALLAELARVSRGWVAVSHWDAASLHVLRRRMGWRKGHDHRVGVSRSELIGMGQAAGLVRRRSRSSLRFISPQTWTLFEKHAPEDAHAD